MNKILLQRIYTKSDSLTGYRILVDRLWPRGISKNTAHLDKWFKDIAPTTELRKWYNHDYNKFDQFQDKYLEEINNNPEKDDFLKLIQSQLKKQDVIILFAAKDENHSQAKILINWLNQNI